MESSEKLEELDQSRLSKASDMFTISVVSYYLSFLTIAVFLFYYRLIMLSKENP